MTILKTRAIVKGMLFNLVNIRNIFYASVEVVPPDTEEAIWTDYLNDFYAPLLPVMASTWTLSTAEIQNLSGIDWFTWREVDLTRVGGNGEPALPNAVAAVLIGHVSAAHGFGRKFISGMANSNYVGNSATGALIAALGSSLLAYIAPITTPAGSHFWPGIYMKSGDLLPFTSGVVSSLLGSMRRRKPGVGF